MTSSNNATAAGLMRQLAELERKGEAESDAYQDLMPALTACLQAMPTAAVAALVQRSPDLDEDEGYWTAINQLRERQDRETFEICRAWAGSEVPLMREAAADVLGQLGAEGVYPFAAESTPLIKSLLEDADVDVVASAVMACVNLDILSPVQLTAFARHSSSEVRFSAVHALMGNDDGASTTALVALCGDVDRDVRNWAVFGLGQMTSADTPAIREALLSRLGEDDAEIRGEALIGLARRGEARVLEPLKRELAGEFKGAWCIEAAAAIAEPSLAPLLADVQARLSAENLDAFGSELDEAMEACSSD